MPCVAALQMCSSHCVTDNLAVASELIADCAQKGAQLVVLPEMFAQIGCKEIDKLDIKEPLGCGPIQDFLSQQAKQHQIYLVGGTVPITSIDCNKVTACCLVYDPSGKPIARYDKMHLFDVQVSDSESYHESDTVTPGESLTLVNTPFGRIGLAVCYDVRFPELFRQLRDKGAQIFVLPAAFTEKTGQAHWQCLLRARAIENICYVVAAAQTGSHDNQRKTYGHSMIIDPWGASIASLQTQPGTIVASIDLEYLQQLRNRMPVHEHQRL